MATAYSYMARHFMHLSTIAADLPIDLYGRGYSDAPQTTYDPTLYTTQLALLMQLIRWDKAIVCGVSMVGGFTFSGVRWGWLMTSTGRRYRRSFHRTVPSSRR